MDRFTVTKTKRWGNADTQISNVYSIGRNKAKRDDVIRIANDLITKESLYTNVGGVACVFIAVAILAAVVGITYVVTGFLAYLWNIGFAPLGVPEVTWWQVTAIWILTAFIAKIIKIFFKS